MFRKIAVLGLATSLTALTSCQLFGGGGEMTGRFSAGTTYYLQTNLHADAGRPTLYSTNYLQSTLLPICTEVSVQAVSGKKMKFTVAATGMEYVYTRDRYLQESFETNLERYFGTECDSTRVNSMSDIDQRGIKAGTALVGMTKDGVILAIGYPPDHATPSLDVTLWQYWKSRMIRRVVNFDEDGIVTSIQG